LICSQKAPPSEREKFADLALDRHARVIGSWPLPFSVLNSEVLPLFGARRARMWKASAIVAGELVIRRRPLEFADVVVSRWRRSKLPVATLIVGAPIARRGGNRSDIVAFTIDRASDAGAKDAGFSARHQHKHLTIVAESRRRGLARGRYRLPSRFAPKNAPNSGF
jgi:hypothetical protein